MDKNLNGKCCEFAALEYISSVDPYIIKLLEWSHILKDLSEDVCKTDMDRELTVKLRMIYAQIIREIGERVHMTF